MINKSDVPILILFFLAILKIVHNIYKEIKKPFIERDSAVCKVVVDSAYCMQHGWPENVIKEAEECIKHSGFIAKIHNGQP